MGFISLPQEISFEFFVKLLEIFLFILARQDDRLSICRQKIKEK